MSESYMSLAVDGYIMPDEIDDYISTWHATQGDEELHEFLGMTWEEYSLWGTDPNNIEIIITARIREQPLRVAVNDNLRGRERLAARSSDARKLAALREWIAAQPDR